MTLKDQLCAIEMPPRWPRLVRTSARIGFFCFFVLAGVVSVQARPIGCAEVVDVEARAAADAADMQVKALWLRVGERFVVSYRLKGGMAAPLEPPQSGAGKLLFQKPASSPVTPDIKGLLAVEDIGCSIYEVGPPRGFVVRFTSKMLIFNENSEITPSAAELGGTRQAPKHDAHIKAGGWTPPLPTGIVHALIVRKNGERWAVRALPGARTSLPEDAVFSRPTGTLELPALSPPKRARRP